MKNRIYTKELFLLRIPIIMTDAVLLLVLFLALALLHPGQTPVEFGTCFLLIISYAITIKVIPVKVTERRISYAKVFIRAIGQGVVTVLVFAFLMWAFYRLHPVNLLASMMALTVLILLVSHLSFRLFITFARKSGRNQLKILFIGADLNNIYIYSTMKQGHGVHGYNVLGFFSDKYSGEVPSDARCLGGMDKVSAYVQTHDIDEIFCSVNPKADPELVNSVIKLCNDKFIQFWFVPNMNGYPHHRMKWEEFGNVPVISLRQEPLVNPFNKFLKRLFDICFSGLFLVTLYPFVWMFAAVGIKLSSPGPILFRQRRTGYNGADFYCLKFRSMKVNADADKVQATADDPRKTKFGDFLRRTSIDELPQFINVFKGDMSVVGPRPHMDFHTEMYSKLISDYMVRHLVQPGITGWAQVNGCRGETRTVEQMKERVEHDIWYIENWSPWLDLKIIFMTVMQVFRGDSQAY